jgi:3-oxoacyl-[acyl-carrier-protein] synthase-3
VHEIDGSGGVSLNLKGGGSLNPPTHETIDKKMHYIYQDGQAVYKFAVRKMAEVATKVLGRNGVTGADLDVFIPHQANKRIITSTADRLGMDPERVIINIDKYGNTSAGTIPLAMETAIEQGKLKKGDLVLLAAVGAGFTVGAALLRWEILRAVRSPLTSRLASNLTRQVKVVPWQHACVCGFAEKSSHSFQAFVIQNVVDV